MEKCIALDATDKFARPGQVQVEKQEVLSHGASFLMVPEILPGEWALSKPLWQLFSKACAWFLQPPEGEGLPSPFRQQSAPQLPHNFSPARPSEFEDASEGLHMPSKL
mmetsp:Transcript_79921/g.133498  ORF Transcript_79921/g.133498 Transcript_79921/m.133498 type:complete len:108 (-) Transcript_79921:232-555(-)